MPKSFHLKIAMMIMAIVIFSVTLIAKADIPRRLYVMNGSAETLSKLNLENLSISQNIVQTGTYPNQLLVHNDLIYVLNSGTDDIMIIDPLDDGRVSRTIALEPGSNPWAMGFAGRNKAYVTNFLANTVSVVDVESGTLLKTIEVGTAPEGILIFEDRAYVANTGFTGAGQPYARASVSIIDIVNDTVTHTLDVPANAQDIAVDPMGRIHVLCTGNYYDVSGQVAIIDLFAPPYWTPAVVDTIHIGDFPGDIAITPSGKGYCISWGDGENGFLYSYDAFADTLLHGAGDPIRVGPNVSRLLYDSVEDVLWIPYMKSWAGDGFIQKFDVKTDEVVWTSGVIGNGTQDAVLLEPIRESDAWADAVAQFSPGDGAGFGDNYFPDNVLGPPDPDPVVNEFSPSNKPQELLSLGHGGEIVLEFTDNYIYDGEGVDFTVFENVFTSFFTGGPYIEAGIVAAVSYTHLRAHET